MSDYAMRLSETIASVEQRCSRQRLLAFALRENAEMQSLVFDALAVLEDYLFELTMAHDEEVRLP